jgi:hypothetical protein
MVTTGRLRAISTGFFLIAGSFLAVAQQPPQPLQPMSFFVTSEGSGKGGDLGGLVGADALCQRLATAAGRGSVTWHAYLSTRASGGQPAVNARDRIGSGPWYNAAGFKIADNLAQLHGDTLELARIGNGITKRNALTEKKEGVPGSGDPVNKHDVLTGSQPDGRAYTDTADHTCSNWTSSAATGSAQIGHSDRNGTNIGISWNSAHPTRGCSIETLTPTGGAGYLYCFAIN